MSSSPEKKKKKLELPETPQPKQTPSLPDEILTSCIARLSRLYYPTLSLVSKSFRSLIASPELYKARSLSGHTESCLYLCLESSSDSLWFTLCLKPNKNKDDVTNNKKSYVLSKVPALHSPPTAVFAGLVSVGSDIYNIRSSSNVSVLDCRSHTWREAPSVPAVKLMALSACVVDEKIYVEGIHAESLRNSTKVWDTRTQTWDHVVPIPCGLRRRGVLNMRSVCINGKSHVVNEEGVVCYNSEQGKWDVSEVKMGLFWFSDSYCVVENVLYSVYDGKLTWCDGCDGEMNKWISLVGSVGRLPKFCPGVSVRLCDYGGKMVVVWDENVLSSGEMMIWCAEIALERRGVWEMWGEVEWIDHVLTVPIGYHIVNALSVTV